MGLILAQQGGWATNYVVDQGGFLIKTTDQVGIGDQGGIIEESSIIIDQKIIGAATDVKGVSQENNIVQDLRGDDAEDSTNNRQLSEEVNYTKEVLRDNCKFYRWYK